MVGWKNHILKLDSAFQDEFPKLSNGTSLEEKLALTETIKDYAEKITKAYIEWYNHAALKSGRTAMSLRWISSTLIVIGSTIAVGRLLDPTTQEGIMRNIFTGSKVVPAEMGLVLFAAAAGLLVADRFANLSANWLRYRIASMSLHRRLVVFRIDWARIMLLSTENSGENRPLNVVELGAPDAPNPPPPESDIERRMDLISELLADLFEITEQECNEWAKQFQQSQSELAQYLKLRQAEPIQGNSRRRGGRV